MQSGSLHLLPVRYGNQALPDVKHILTLLWSYMWICTHACVLLRVTREVATFAVSKGNAQRFLQLRKRQQPSACLHWMLVRAGLWDVRAQAGQLTSLNIAICSCDSITPMSLTLCSPESVPSSTMSLRWQDSAAAKHDESRSTSRRQASNILMQQQPEGKAFKQGVPPPAAVIFSFC